MTGLVALSLDAYEFTRVIKYKVSNQEPMVPSHRAQGSTAMFSPASITIKFKKWGLTHPWKLDRIYIHGYQIKKDGDPGAQGRSRDVHPWASNEGLELDSRHSCAELPEWIHELVDAGAKSLAQIGEGS